MTLEEIKEKYKYALKVTCTYQNNLKKEKRSVYIPMLSTIRKLHDLNEYVCDDFNHRTSFIGLWDPIKGFAEIIEEHVPQKFIDNSKDASNTFLDEQLRNLQKIR